MICRIIVSLFFTCLALSCEQSNTKRRAPEERVRPDGVPEGAFWAGDAKGGHWFFVDHVHAHRNNASIRVYNGDNGLFIVSKRFSVCCRFPADRPIEHFVLIDSLPAQIKGFDGKKIYFKNLPDSTDCWME